MGTRADFYIGTGPAAEWLGSIAFDGHRVDEMTEAASFRNMDSMECWAIKSAKSDDAFRGAVVRLLALNDDATTPDQGWPWPWLDSHTTDYAYAFVAGECKTFIFGNGAEWPNMKDRQNVTYGERSGTITLVSNG